MAKELVVSSFMDRWKDNPDIKGICTSYLKDIKIFEELAGTTDREKRVELRKIWGNMSDNYWRLFELSLVAMAKADVDGITFSEKEKLLLDCGFLSPSVTPFNSNYADWLKQDKPSDLFGYYSFTELMAETYCLYFNKNDERLFDRLNEVFNSFKQKLSVIRRKTNLSLKVLLSQHPDLSSERLDEILSKIDGNLESYLEKHMRTRRFREMEKSDYDTVVDEANSFSFSVKEVQRLLREATRHIDGFEENERLKMSSMLDELIFMGTQYFHVRNEIDRLKRAVERSAAKFKKESKSDRLENLEKEIRNKKDMAGQMARISRADTSPLSLQSHDMPLSFDVVSPILNKLLKMDEDMLRVPRVRMYGVPRVVIVPGVGQGVYDWTDNTFMLPLYPSKTPEQAIAYAVASFRWDADEDREFKNTYELLKENKGKSIKGLALSFCSDYYLWMIKERSGYRVLNKEVRKWFMAKFAPRDGQ